MFTILICCFFAFLSMSTTASGVDPNTYQHILVSGRPFDRGFSHGQQAKDKILLSISKYQNSSSLPPWENCTAFVKANYIKGLQTYFPNGLEEMKGIAKGAGVQLTDILILNARYDLGKLKRWEEINNQKVTFPANDNDIDTPPMDLDECTGAVVLKSATKNKEVLLGQNWDISNFIYENDTAIILEVHPHPCEQIAPFFMLGEAGQLGRTGMNKAGLGVLAMSLWSSEDHFNLDDSDENSNGWIPFTLLRRKFLESPNFSLGIQAILKTPRHVSGNIIIATSENEALNIELTPTKYFITQVPIDKEIYTHSNHFNSKGFISRGDIEEGSRGSSSLFRDRRVEKILTNFWPKIDEESLQMALRDQVGRPNGVCQKQIEEGEEWTSASPNSMTVASVTYNLSKRKMKVSKGPPCVPGNVYHEYNFTTLPLEICIRGLH